MASTHRHPVFSQRHTTWTPLLRPGIRVARPRTVLNLTSKLSVHTQVLYFSFSKQTWRVSCPTAGLLLMKKSCFPNLTLNIDVSFPSNSSFCMTQATSGWKVQWPGCHGDDQIYDSSRGASCLSLGLPGLTQNTPCWVQRFRLTESSRHSECWCVCQPGNFYNSL